MKTPLICRWLPILFICFICGAAPCVVFGTDEPEWIRTTTQTGRRDIIEEVLWRTTDDGIRVFVNRPIRSEQTAKSPLLIFATPNGNSIEETLGSAPLPELNFRFGIQQIMAQVRYLRSSGDESATGLTLAVVQAPKLSWPAFRSGGADAGLAIPSLVDELIRLSGADEVSLCCHSGGGAFVLEYIQRRQQIPDIVRRMAFLDANYSWDEKLHQSKVMHWLHGADSRRLIVLAYDDREISLNGKKVIGPDGGTWRATERMKLGLSGEMTLSQDTEGPFLRTTGLNGQVLLLQHPNPENKILHTSLVGDMNGLIRSMITGTSADRGQGSLSDAPVYQDWIPREPFRAPSRWQAKREESPEVHRLPLPERPENSASGTMIAQDLEALAGEQREARIEQEILSGNVPALSRQLVPVSFTARDRSGKEHRLICYVVSDVLSIGSDVDALRIPMRPETAARIARNLNCELMTTRLSDVVFDAADTRLTPHPMTENRESVTTFLQHQQFISRDLAAFTHPILIAGHKKDIVQTPLLKDSQHVALYGWHLPHGQPIQNLYVKHFASYVDYSHGVRLVLSDLTLDGQSSAIRKILADEELRPLLLSAGELP